MNILSLLLLIQCGIVVASTNLQEPTNVSQRQLRGGNIDINNNVEESRLDISKSRNLLDLGPLNTARYLGQKELLVIRIEAKDSSTTASESEVRYDVFESEVNVPKQFEACSRGKLSFRPAQGTNIKDGVATVKLNKVVGKMAFATNGDSVVKDIESMAPTMFGRELRGFDQVIMCMPPGVTVVNPSGVTTDKFTAFVPGDKPYAFFVSIYNDDWCTSLSAGMHEIGHTLGLNHATEVINGQHAEYEDETGMMGYSAKSKTTPLKCFNPAKAWQLGWYAEQSKRINPLIDAPLRTILTGITRDINDNDQSKNILIQIPNGDKNIYIGYNHAIQYNSETEADKANKVLIMEQDYGGSKMLLAKSSVLSKLGDNESHTIENFHGSGKNLIIRVHNKISGGSEVPVDIYFENEIQPYETACKDGQVRFEVNFVTDAYSSGNVGWDLISDETKNTVASHPVSDSQLYSMYNKLVCIDPEKDYTFTFNARHGIGICCNGGFGFYSAFLEGEEIFRGGEFGSFKFEGDTSPKVYSVSHKFRAEKGSLEQLSSLFVPLQTPSSCIDNPTYRWKGRAQWDCAWVAEEKDKRCSKEINGERVRDHCQRTCDDSCTGVKDPRLTPVTAPTNAPGNNVFCLDDPNFAWKNTPSWNCDWVAEEKEKRCSRSKDGVNVKDLCQKTCGTCSGSTKPSADESKCIDDPNFAWKNTPTWNCDWVAAAKNKRCGKSKNGVTVNDHCRKTCGTCSAGTNPTPSPGVDPPTDEDRCIDDPNFTWKNNPNWTCKWVGKARNKRCGKKRNGVKVSDHCRKTCRSC